MLPRVARPIISLTSRASNCIENGVKIVSGINFPRHHHKRNHHTGKCTGPVIPSFTKYLQSKIKSIEPSLDKDVLTLQFEGQPSLSFPIVWLKDNCQCDDCYDSIAKSRIIDQVTFRPDSKPKSMEVDENSLKVTWDDGHKSEFSKEWLCRNSFEESHQKERQRKYHEERLPWNAEEFQMVFRTFSFKNVMNDDETLLRWLVSLARHGAVLVNDAPSDDGTVKMLAERVAFVRSTLYGEIFYVKSQEQAKNTAYKKGKLQLHSDMPHYRHLPGTIFLHCIVQSKVGGENLLTDGLNAAKELTKEEYQVLTDTVINWSDVGADGRFQFHAINREPVICEDKLGNIEKINWSQPQRDSTFDVPLTKATAWYKAMSRYTQLLHDPKNAVTLKTHPGEILTIDNRRVMHSRANYSDGARQLNGAYVDWDEIYSKIRDLRSKLNLYD